MLFRGEGKTGVSLGSKSHEFYPMLFRGEGKTGGGKLLQFFLIRCPKQKHAVLFPAATSRRRF